MRWLEEFRREDGVSAVLIALMIIPLLAMAALVIDIGMMYWEVRQLQNGADAAAIAIAQECADDEGTCPGNAQAVADTFTDVNSNDGASSAVVDLDVTNRIVTVTAETVESDGSTGLTLFFARILNAAPETYGRAATAIWGPAGLPEVSIPLTLAECEWKLKDGDGKATILIKGNPGANECLDETNPGMYEPGGFGWLDPTLEGCAAEILEWTPGNTGNTPPTNECNHVNFDWQDLVDRTVTLPIHNGTNDLSGDNAEFQMIGVASFRIDYIKVGGAQYTAGSGSCPGTGSNQRCLIGRFVDYVPLDQFVNPSGEDFGTTAVQLVG